MALDQQFLDAVIANNQAAGVTWIAGPTSMLELTPAQRARRFGYVPGPGEPSLAERMRIGADPSRHKAGDAAGSGSFDWRNAGGRNFISDVKDQGQCGSCVAFGTAATIDANMRIVKNIAVNDSNATVLSDVSEAQLFFCNGDQGVTCELGWYPAAALSYAAHTGLAPEAVFPYSDHDQACLLASGWDNQVTKVGECDGLMHPDDMKQQIASIGPLVTGFTVFADFLAYKSGVYRWNQKDAALAGHCVCVIGYDDAQQAWICKNSWGTGWGLSGFFLIGYGQCGIDATMWSISGFKQIYEAPPAA